MKFRRILVLCVAGFLAAPGPLHAQKVRSLFDGRSLAGWEVTDFIGHGPVEAEEGSIVLGMGDPLTGITWTGEFPRVGYEVTLQATRVEGRDFFAAITFPVGDAPCTLVIGGWGGSVVGLSSIAGEDASQNETTRGMRFENGRWYRIRLRVTEEKIQAWIDDEPVVDFSHVGRLLSIRVEVWGSQPFGIASWMTRAALRNIELRMLSGSDSGAPSAS